MSSTSEILGNTVVCGVMSCHRLMSGVVMSCHHVMSGVTRSCHNVMSVHSLVMVRS